MANLRTNNLSGEQGQNAIRGSVFFDGFGDKLSVPNSADVRLGSNDFTMEAWVKFGDVSGYWDSVLGMYDESADRRTYYLARYKSSGAAEDGRLYMYVNTDGTSGGYANVQGGFVSINDWHHVAGVRDGNTLRLYLNGVQVGSSSFSGTIYNNTTDALFIGDVESDDNKTMNGFISNVRLINGTCIYPDGTTFTPPQQELTLVPNTVLLACQNSDDVTQEATGKTITAAGNLTDAAYVRMQPKVIPPYGVDAGNTFGGTIQQSSQGYMYFPTGKTEERGRGRGIIAGGSPGSDNNEQIEFFDIQSDGVVTVFGELITSRRGCGGCSSSTRGLIGGGTASNPSPTFTNSMEFITIATTANGTDFGDLNNASRNIGGVSNQTRGLFAGGGDNPALIDVIDFFTIASTGDATDFGNLTDAKKGVSGVGSPTRGLFAGGYNPSHTDDIDLVTIASTGNATDFGNLTLARAFCGGVSSPTRGVWGGGGVPSAKSNVIDFVTIATTGNATDFGDLLDQRNPDNSQICSHLRGLFVGGENPGPSACKLVDVVTIATTGNATNFGDIKTSTSQSAGCSDSHGGLS